MKKTLYIFDFDETLVRVNAKIYVLNKENDSKKELSLHEFYSYKLKENEYYDISEFDEVKNPKINEKLMKLLYENQNKSVILTARDKSKPVKEFLLSIGVVVPVNAVGVNKPTSNSVFENARRKKEWVKLVVKQKKYDYIEFWDDNELNIKAVKELIDEFPEIIFKLNLVEMK